MKGAAHIVRERRRTHRLRKALVNIGTAGSSIQRLVRERRTDIACVLLCLTRRLLAAYSPSNPKILKNRSNVGCRSDVAALTTRRSFPRLRGGSPPPPASATSLSQG
eukprot:1195499-Prorocentrum_minimum.AAC.2